LKAGYYADRDDFLRNSRDKSSSMKDSVRHGGDEKENGLKVEDT